MNTSMTALALEAGFEGRTARALFDPRHKVPAEEFVLAAAFATEGDRAVALALARLEPLRGAPRELLMAIAALLGGCNRSALLGPRSIVAPHNPDGRHPPVITSRANVGHLLAGRAGLVVDLGQDPTPSWSRADGRTR